MNEQVRSGFSHFYRSQGDLLHCTAHSHHAWPDCTREAQLQAWEDGAALTDAKWDKVFGEVVPEAQSHIARELHLSEPSQIVFAPNTHEFVTRLYSCLDWTKPTLKVLTTAHEFHSFNRQTRRLEETGKLQVTRIEALPYESFASRLKAALASQVWDMVWLSQVQFDSGFLVQDLPTLLSHLPKQTLVVLDGYHAFMAMPVDGSAMQTKAFYLAGGYKYAMAGEGACFLVVPQGCELRPLNTGWFADFAGLSQTQGAVGYAQDGARFFGATFDPSALYRFNAVQRWLQSLNITTELIHTHVNSLQMKWLERLQQHPIKTLPVTALCPPLGTPRGNYLTFDLPHAQALHKALEEAHIRTDRRGTRLRFGFGLYHDHAFIDQLTARLENLPSSSIVSA